MEQINCPYCDAIIETAVPDKFQACPSCGYSSARVDAGANQHLIIDSKLPDLMKRCRELSGNDNGNLVVIDRRVGHNPIAGADRRR